MATASTLQQEKLDSALDLNLSLGGLFSHLPAGSSRQIRSCANARFPDAERRTRDVSAYTHQRQKRGRPELYEVQSASLCISSGALSEDNCSKLAGNSEQSALKDDKNMGGYDVCSKVSEESHRMHTVSDLKRRKAMGLEQAVPGESDSRGKCTLHRPNTLELPRSFASCSHSPTVSCTSCAHTQTSPSNTHSCRSPTLNASYDSLPSSDVAMFETGSNGARNNNQMLPAKRKSSIEDEDRSKIYLCNSDESENRDNPAEKSTIGKKAAMMETPRSRCGSSNDLIGSMDTFAANLCSSSRTYMHPSAMMPLQGQFPVPMQWGLALPYFMPYASLCMSPHTSSPWIPYFPGPASGVLPSLPAASCEKVNLQDNEEPSNKENALNPRCSPKTMEALHAAEVTKQPPAMVHKPILQCASEACASAASVQPSCSTTSATSPATNGWSETEVDGVKEDPTLNASKSSLIREGSFMPVLHSQKSHDPGLLGKEEQSGHSKNITPSGRKLAKTVRFCCEEKEFDKSTLSEKQMRGSSSLLSREAFRNQVVKRLQGLGEKALFNLVRQKGGIMKGITEESEQQDESDNSRITSESSDQDESVPAKAEGKAGSLDGKIAASLPRVSTTCEGPNGKTVHGVMYITKSRQACLICSCHGRHMSPSEFVRHSGRTDVRNPERNIVVTRF